MKPDYANALVAEKFIYRPDRNFSRDPWAILDTSKEHIYGDCEDYSATVLWLIVDRSVIGLVSEIFSGKAAFVFAKLPSGEGHYLLRYKGKMVDNIERRWFDSHPRYSNMSSIRPARALFKLAQGLLIKK